MLAAGQYGTPAMNDIRVARHIHLLGAEAARLRDTIEAALEEDGTTDEPVDVPIADAAGFIVELTLGHMSALVRLFNSPGAARAGSNAGSKADTYRFAGRLEEAVDRLLHMWRAARALEVAPGGGAFEHDLLTDGVRNVLTQVAEVLDSLSYAIDHPEIHDADDGETVSARLRFELQAPAEFGQLADWCRSQAASASFWSTGATLALGALLGHAASSDRCPGDYIATRVEHAIGGLT